MRASTRHQHQLRHEHRSASHTSTQQTAQSNARHALHSSMAHLALATQQAQRRHRDHARRRAVARIPLAVDATHDTRRRVASHLGDHLRFEESVRPSQSTSQAPAQHSPSAHRLCRRPLTRRGQHESHEEPARGREHEQHAKHHEAERHRVRHERALLRLHLAQSPCVNARHPIAQQARHLAVLKLVAVAKQRGAATHDSCVGLHSTRERLTHARTHAPPP
jgi:hypothetical protein